MPKKKRRAGRPPGSGESIVEAIRRATLKRLTTHGFEKLSITQIAKDAGLTRSSVYRRYPTRQKLFIAAIQGLNRGTDWDIQPTGKTRADLVRILNAKGERALHPASRMVTRSLITVEDPGVRPMMRMFHDSSVIQATAVLANAVGQGEVGGRANLAIAAELLNAFILYRTYWLKAPFDDASIQAVVDLLLLGLKKRSRSRGPR